MGDPSKESLLLPFGIPPETSRLVRIAHGFINETYAVETPQGTSFILQQLNPSVFQDYRGIMENLQKALPYLHAPGYQKLVLFPTLEGNSFYTDEEGRPWRVLNYIQDSYSIDASDRPGIAAEAGHIIGRFHQLVAPANPEDFIPVLPRFHDLAHRIGQLQDARKKADPDRLQKASNTLLVCEELIREYGELALDGMPIRLCHNDTKLSNILFRKADDKALCLIDLDTLMPGFLLYDLGDALRTLVNPQPEDDPHPRKIHTNLDMFRAFVEGLRDSGLEMTPGEEESLDYATAYMCLLHGVRALTDYFLGDVHYRVRYPDQNLVRATNLLGTARSATENREALQKIRKEVFT